MQLSKLFFGVMMCHFPIMTFEFCPSSYHVLEQAHIPSKYVAHVNGSYRLSSLFSPRSALALYRQILHLRDQWSCLNYVYMQSNLTVPKAFKRLMPYTFHNQMFISLMSRLIKAEKLLCGAYFSPPSLTRTTHMRFTLSSSKAM